jgi:hypothetical protein
MRQKYFYPRDQTYSTGLQVLVEGSCEILGVPGFVIHRQESRPGFTLSHAETGVQVLDISCVNKAHVKPAVEGALGFLGMDGAGLAERIAELRRAIAEKDLATRGDSGLVL